MAQLEVPGDSSTVSEDKPGELPVSEQPTDLRYEVCAPPSQSIVTQALEAHTEAEKAAQEKVEQITQEVGSLQELAAAPAEQRGSSQRQQAEAVAAQQYLPQQLACPVQLGQAYPVQSFSSVGASAQPVPGQRQPGPLTPQQASDAYCQQMLRLVADQTASNAAAQMQHAQNVANNFPDLAIQQIAQQQALEAQQQMLLAQQLAMASQMPETARQAASLIQQISNQQEPGLQSPTQPYIWQPHGQFAQAHAGQPQNPFLQGQTGPSPLPPHQQDQHGQRQGGQSENSFLQGQVTRNPRPDGSADTSQDPT